MNRSRYRFPTLSVDRSPQPHPREPHVCDEGLERYCLGMPPELELALFEEHLLACADCASRAEEAKHHVNAIRNALRSELKHSAKAAE